MKPTVIYLSDYRQTKRTALDALLTDMRQQVEANAPRWRGAARRMRRDGWSSAAIAAVRGEDERRGMR